ncbi:hypothetical protein JXJ21_19580 [candidate division KSB1 bacterium]|nr:hypothetical protein [candidate division KSB1 bacterium]
MKMRILTGALLSIVVILSACDTGVSTRYEACYIVLGDSLVTINKDSLISVADTIHSKPVKIQMLKDGDNIRAIDGNILYVTGQISRTNAQPDQVTIHYVLKNVEDVQLAELRVTDSDSTQAIDTAVGFETMVFNGNVGLISKALGDHVCAINEFANRDISAMKGKKESAHK